MVTKKEEIHCTEAFTGILLNGEGKPDLFMQNCPDCHSADVKVNSTYKTKRNGERSLYACQACGVSFSETYDSPISGLTTSWSEIIQVLKARMEGMGLNASERVFGFTKKTILNWEKRFAALQETLFLYALVHDFFAANPRG